MITSFVPGRIRLRSPMFFDTEITQTLLAVLRRVKAVRKIDLNGKTGSLLILYSSEAVPAEKLKPLLPLACELKPAFLFYSGKEKQTVLKAIRETALFLEREGFFYPEINSEKGV